MSWLWVCDLQIRSTVSRPFFSFQVFANFSSSLCLDFDFLKHVFFSFCNFPLHFITTMHLFNGRCEGQIYSMLISLVHEQPESSVPDDLESSSHAVWSNFPLHFLLPLCASCKCDNVLCSEIHTQKKSVHLAPKKPCVLFWMNGRTGEEWLSVQMDLSKRTTAERSCLTACHQLSWALLFITKCCWKLW